MVPSMINAIRKAARETAGSITSLPTLSVQLDTVQLINLDNRACPRLRGNGTRRPHPGDGQGIREVRRHSLNSIGVRRDERWRKRTGSPFASVNFKFFDRFSD